MTKPIARGKPKPTRAPQVLHYYLFTILINLPIVYVTTEYRLRNPLTTGFKRENF